MYQKSVGHFVTAMYDLTSVAVKMLYRGVISIFPALYEYNLLSEPVYVDFMVTQRSN
jgi:hypothetical protein